MNLTDGYIRSIAERTVFLQERWGGEFVAKPQQDREKNARLVEKWRLTVAGGDPAVFAKRLALDQLPAAAVDELIGEVRWPDGQPLPVWLEIFQAIIAKTREISGENRQTAPEAPGDSGNFNEVRALFLAVARDRLQAVCGAGLNLADTKVRQALEGYLENWLARLCLPVLRREYKLFLMGRQPVFSGALGLFANQAGDSAQDSDAYRLFIEKLYATGFRPFFAEYPVLARIVSTCILEWVESVAEFFQRLQADLPAIRQTFGKDAAGGFTHLLEARMGLSDRHNRGRTVFDLTFAAGCRLIYKPRSLTLEAAYNQLLAWLNKQGTVELKTLAILEREGYGWVEFAEHFPCTDEAAVKRYYERSGALLAVLTLLRGGDVHFENLIACGEYPVLIDLETLLQVEARFFQDRRYETSASHIANEALANSVLHTGLLPNWIVSPDNVAYDVSGLAGPVRHEDGPGGAKESGFAAWGGRNNIPVVNGRAAPPFAYEQQLVDGFTAVYDCFARYKQELLEPGGILERFSAQPFRFIFRATRVYDQLLARLLRPDVLADAVRWSIEADILARVLLKPQVQEYFVWPLVQAETRSLMELDVPRFTGRSDGCALMLAEKTLPDFFAVRAYDQVTTRVEQLGGEDLDRQIDFLRASLRVHLREDGGGAACVPSTAALAAADLLGQAESLARQLAAGVVAYNGADAAWLGYEYLEPTTALQLRPVNYGLYSGLCGIALFLAAAGSMLPGRGFGELAWAAANAVVRTVEDPLLRGRLEIAGIGGANGLGSLVYGLTGIAGFLQEPGFLQAATDAARLIEPLLASDNRFDVTGGAAGAMLGLLKLYSVTGNNRILAGAQACAAYLLARQSRGGWLTIASRPAAGFAHGLGGIAYALARLYEFDRREELLTAAQAAIACENELYSPECQNWRDVRKIAEAETREQFQSSWCHGAPGIGLARVGMLRFLPAKQLQADAENALKTTAALPLSRYDHVCCGNFGCVEALVTAGSRLKHAEWRQAGLSLAVAAVYRAKTAGSFGLPFGMQKFAPGFFNGISGIGYELLRLAEPEKIPSVLLFE